jgi:hypothetical protein
VVRGTDQQDQPIHPPIPLLEGRRAKLSLGVVESGDRLDRDRLVVPRQQRIEGAQVAGEVEGRLELPAPSVADARAEASEEVQLGGVAEAAADRVEAGVKPQPNRCAVSGQISELDGTEAALEPADVEARGAEGAGHIGLGQTTSQARIAEFGTDLRLEALAGDPCIIDPAGAVGHAPMLIVAPYRGVRSR